jgi:hypothetical protein
MKNKEELVLKATKEIVVKFIEMGRVSPNSFQSVWEMVRRTIGDSLAETEPEDQ